MRSNKTNHTKDYEVVKKAWRVIDIKQTENKFIYENINDLDFEIVHAETRGKAKMKCYDYTHFFNVRTRRAKDQDIILFNNKQMLRFMVEEQLTKEQKINARREKVLNYSERELFYIQNGYVGNAILWWGLNGSGYTTDILYAQKYTREEVLTSFVNGRSEDRIWPVSHVNKNTKLIVDGQNLSRDMSC